MAELIKRSNVAFLTDQDPPVFKLPPGDYEYFAANDKPDAFVMVRKRDANMCRQVACRVRDLIDG